ncbi:hypothetical protein CCICO_11220 [Corynebacterium ciconiae DSM 44920]|uniref:hypothetical protein n=1 Tax=Corynebacterium ciconiae TaxID=227319 RepID=UPI000363D4B9|nr:hypothetical protein [Corynebacterium ciconiae]WKD62235.1 hypothetical protein CCICO_11220 [Corynebacterium ciconiae DSM 44920]
MTATGFSRPLRSSMRMNSTPSDIIGVIGLAFVALLSAMMDAPAQGVMILGFGSVVYATLRNKVRRGAWALGVNSAGRLQLYRGPMLIAAASQLPACIILAGLLRVHNNQLWWNSYAGLAALILGVYILEALLSRRAQDRPHLEHAGEQSTWFVRPTTVLVRALRRFPLRVQLTMPTLIVLFLVAQVLIVLLQLIDWSDPEFAVVLISVIASMGGVFITQEPASLGTWLAFGLSRTQWLKSCFAAIAVYSVAAAACATLSSALLGFDSSAMSFPGFVLAIAALSVLLMMLSTFNNPYVMACGIPFAITAYNSTWPILNHYGYPTVFNLVLIMAATLVLVWNVKGRAVRTDIRVGVKK